MTENSFIDLKEARGMSKKRPRKVYPSQERYYQNNPTVSARLSKEKKDKLQRIAENEGKTISKWLNDFLDGILDSRQREVQLERENRKLKADINKLKNQVKEVNNQFRIVVPCKVCGESVVFGPSVPNWEQILDRVVKSIGPVHKGCYKRWL